MASAGHVFGLDKPLKDKSTRRAHLLQLQKATGVRPADLDGPAMPREVRHVYDWFRECRAGYTMDKPITWEGIHAYCSLTGTTMWPEEVRLLKSFDMTFLRVMNER